MLSNARKREIDRWIHKGFCARHKYINGIFRFLWKYIKDIIFGIILGIAFIVAMLLYRILKKDA